jgi:type IV pilus assembly protein PilW
VVAWGLQGGATLLECLVGLALGLVVVAAVAVHYLATGQSSRLQAAQAQMTEDAQIGLELLRTELMMAGFAQPQKLVLDAQGRPRWQTALAGQPPLVACDKGFVLPRTVGSVVCAADGPSAALEISYQADAFNTVPLSDNSTPTDCLGNGLKDPKLAPLTRNRWYVDSSQGRSELRCASQLGNPGQPLVDNVEVLALWFSVAQAADPKAPVRYVKASQVDSFSRVRSVRLCLLMRSTDAVLAAEDALAYLDCEGTPQTSSDRRLRRAFHAVVALRAAPGG